MRDLLSPLPPAGKGSTGASQVIGPMLALVAVPVLYPLTVLLAMLWPS